MIEKASVTLRVNGATRHIEVEPRRILADVLRDELGLRSIHLGCEQGACGGCTVLVDGLPAASCLMLAAQAEGRSIETLEGLADTDRMRRLRSAFHEHYAVQCGYCIPGVLVNLYEYLGADGPRSESDVRARLSGNLCRCTGYQNMVAAAVAASAGGETTDGGLEELPGVGPELASRLKAHGFATRSDLARASEAELMSLRGIGLSTARRLIATAAAESDSTGDGSPR